MQGDATSPKERDAKWYVKWLIASYACSFGASLLLGIAALPFVGYKVFDLFFSAGGGFLMFVLMVVSAAVIYPRLK
jgi:hypothetical protein